MRRTGYNNYFPEELKEVFRELDSGLLGDPNVFRELLDTIKHNNDKYLIGADFSSYRQAQEKADELYMRPEKWTAMSIKAALRMEKFSSDRTIQEYAQNIW